MKSASPCVLAVNVGSSSIRFAVYEVAGALRPGISGKIDRIGMRGTTLVSDEPAGKGRVIRVPNGSRRSASAFLLQWLEAQPVFARIGAVGHRLVHGMRHTRPERVTPRLLADLRRITPFDPDHLPGELGLIEALKARHPGLVQVACFDTAFHRTMPRVARMLPLPRRITARGVERYGFHGLSYAFLMEELRRIDPRGANGRVVLAHLGSGASVAAVLRGRSIDTSMGFTPASGLVMGTRTGDIDPGVPYFLSRTEGMSPSRFQRLVNHESGLLGISGTSADIRDLLSRESRDSRAAAAIEVFCYQARKWIGSMAAALGGLDTLVFAGGIGENSPAIRSRICDGLGFLGVRLDSRRNSGNAGLISGRTGPVSVRVVPTDEELMIARYAAGFLRR